jgi:hypothetical protein
MSSSTARWSPCIAEPPTSCTVASVHGDGYAAWSQLTPASTSMTVVVGASAEVVAGAAVDAVAGAVVDGAVDVVAGAVVDGAVDVAAAAAPTDSAGTAMMANAIDTRGLTSQRGYRGDRSAVRHPRRGVTC